MQTRSQTKKELTIIIINFDEASSAWNKNKKSIGNGHYKYVCLQKKQCGIKCKNICYKESEYCWSHRKQKPQNNIFVKQFKAL